MTSLRMCANGCDRVAEPASPFCKPCHALVPPFQRRELAVTRPGSTRYTRSLREARQIISAARARAEAKAPAVRHG
ncbi:MAG TPA: hypothetical protein VFJ16_31290 [Longimicrobium sp.]|nr:hypothetical protein [Longimicrobium sp.]